MCGTGQSHPAARHRQTGPAQYPADLADHLEWWRAYYHFVRPHESLKMRWTQSIPPKGKRNAARYRQRTPAQAAGLTDHRWRVQEVLSYPLL